MKFYVETDIELTHVSQNMSLHHSQPRTPSINESESKTGIRNHTHRNKKAKLHDRSVTTIKVLDY